MHKIKAEDPPNPSLTNGYDSYIRNTIEPTVDPQVRAHIDNLIRDVSAMRDTERLLFSLLLPSDPSATLSSLNFSAEDLEINSSSFEASGLHGPPGASSALHLSNQLEQSQAYTWIISHLEEDPSTCLRKDEVYEDYRIYCERHHLKVLNTADFGKVMKRAFPNVKPRRLGQRGQSRYCYGGMRKRVEVQPPCLPDVTGELTGAVSQSGQNGTSNDPALGASGSVLADVAHVILQYVQQLLGVSFNSLYQLAQHLISNRYVNARSKHAFALIAHASNNQFQRSASPNSQNLANTFTEVLQKGFSSLTSGKEDFSRLRQSSSSTIESLEDRKGYTKKDSVSSTPSTPKSPCSTGPTVPTSHSTPTQQMHYISQSTANPSSLLSDDNRTTPTNSIKVDYLSPTSTPVSGPRHSSSPYLQDQSKPDVPYAFNYDPKSSTLDTSNTSSTGTAYSHQSVAMMMAAALAARQHQQMSSDEGSVLSRLSNYSASSNYSPSPAHKQASFDSTTDNVSGLLRSTDSANSFLLGSPYNGSASSSFQRSPLPPAPRQPIAGAKSPYTPTYQMGPGSRDANSAPRNPAQNGKRNFATPMDAPGSYDPSPQMHLGKMSPSKRTRYNFSGSESSTSYQRDTSKNAVGSALEDSSSASSSVFYPGRYENLGMLSPLPSEDMLQQAEEARSRGYQMNVSDNSKPTRSHGSDKRVDGNSIYNPPSFSLALEEDSCYGIVDLPRLGASPGPPILPEDSGPDNSGWHTFYNSQQKEGANSSQEDSLNRTLTGANEEDDELLQRNRMRGEVNTPPAPKELMLLQPTSPTATGEFRDDEQLHTPGPVDDVGSSQCSSPSGPGAPTLASSGAESSSSTHPSECPNIQNSPGSIHSTASSPLACKGVRMVDTLPSLRS